MSDHKIWYAIHLWTDYIPDEDVYECAYSANDWGSSSRSEAIAMAMDAAKTGHYDMVEIIAIDVTDNIEIGTIWAWNRPLF